MKQPEFVLEEGVKVITHAHCSEAVGTTGMLVHQRHLKARRGNTKGTIQGWIPGHGGDVYWVAHEDKTVGAYCFAEFELDVG